MPCYKPLQAWRAWDTTQSKFIVTFSFKDVEFYDISSSIDFACGQCIGCRLERSRRWAVRIMHEAQMHEDCCFLTLTYSDENVPKDGSLRVADFQLFMKRLRRGSDVPLRFFHCGEYGETTFRPHYHVCLFGDAFRSDRVVHSSSSRGDTLFVSDRLTSVWGLGHAVIGDLSFESAAYVARYCLKKVTGKSAAAHYGARSPEYVTMSRRPGIGASWFKSFGREVYPSDSVVIRGREMMPPPFYDLLLERVDPKLFARVKRARVLAAPEMGVGDTASRRLLDRRIVKEKTISNMLGRDL